MYTEKLLDVESIQVRQSENLLKKNSKSSLSKKTNFTKEMLEERIKRFFKKGKKILRILDEMDKKEDTEEDLEQEARNFYEEKLEESQDQIGKYGNYQKHMEETGKRQLSLMDEDGKSMVLTKTAFFKVK